MILKKLRLNIKEKIEATNKTLKGCIDYCKTEARKQAEDGCAMIPDDEVYEWAVHYFLEDSMMEELKFRAWVREKNYGIDRDTKKVIELNDSYKMVNVSSIHLGTKKIVYGYSEDSYHYGNRSVSFDKIKLMQYQNFKDKNNKEIYECDIVLINGHKYVVVDEEGIFAKAIEKYQVDFDWETIRRAKKDNFDLGIEVLGNIYENPELLEGDEE